MDDCRPLGKGRGHHQVGCSENGWAATAAQKTFTAGQAVGLCVDIARIHSNFCTEVAHTFQVKIYRARADDASTGHRHFGLVKTTHQWPKYTDGSAHFTDQIVVTESLDLLRANANRSPAGFHLGAERFQNPTHESDIA